jgi:hypothetical protein
MCVIRAVIIIGVVINVGGELGGVVVLHVRDVVKLLTLYK